jgi:hypothetical protein
MYPQAHPSSAHVFGGQPPPSGTTIPPALPPDPPPPEVLPPVPPVPVVPLLPLVPPEGLTPLRRSTSGLPEQATTTPAVTLRSIHFRVRICIRFNPK